MTPQVETLGSAIEVEMRKRWARFHGRGCVPEPRRSEGIIDPHRAAVRLSESKGNLSAIIRYFLHHVIIRPSNPLFDTALVPTNKRASLLPILFLSIFGHDSLPRTALLGNPLGE